MSLFRSYIILTASLFLLFFSAYGGEGLAGKRALYIASYHPAFSSFDRQVEALRNALKDTGVGLDIEFMDTKRVLMKIEFASLRRI